MAYTVASVAYSDAPGLSETMMRAMNQDPHYGLILNGATTEELIADTGLRLQYNLSRDRTLLRHQKVIDTDSGDVVGYARWELPKTGIEFPESVWPDAQIPAPKEEQEKSFKANFDLTEHEGKRKIFNYEMGDYIGPALGKAYNELVGTGGPYLVLDYLVCHPSHQRKGVASILLERGEAEARKVGLNIFVMTATDPAGAKFYERHGFKNLRTVTLDDSKWGGTTPHVTSFLEKEA